MPSISRRRFGWLRNWLTAGGCLLLASALSSAEQLGPFTSDGCSLFPDSSLITAEDWCACCFVHDVQYWRGGTKAQRLAADEALHQCVLNRTDDPVLAKVMYEGVRFGGSPYFYNWYRWGYGWPYGRMYQPLSAAEQARAQVLLDDYLADADNPICPLSVLPGSVR